MPVFPGRGKPAEISASPVAFVIAMKSKNMSVLVPAGTYYGEDNLQREYRNRPSQGQVIGATASGRGGP